MILGAIVVGLLTAYYFGLRAGQGAGIAAMALFVLAAVMPDLQIWAYGVVAVGVVGVVTVGPTRQRPDARRELLDWLRTAVYVVYRRVGSMPNGQRRRDKAAEHDEQ